MNCVTPLIDQARERGDAMAIIQPSPRGDHSITFAQLESRSAALAHWLEGKGLKPGDRVLVMIPVSIELYVALPALLRCGLVAEFLDPSAGRDHVRLCCEAAPPDALLGSLKAQLLRVLHPGLRRVHSLVYPGWCAPSLEGGRDHEPRSCEADTPALLTFTSGSTAAPKAAVRTHGLLAAQQSALARAIDLQPGQVDLATLPIFVLANLAAGVTTVLADADIRKPGFIEPDPVLDQLTQHAITRSTASPAFFDRLAQRCEQTGRTLSPLQRIYTGGAPVFPDLLERLDRLMPEGGPVTVYGSTEAEPIAHLAFDEASDADRAAMRDGKGLLVGTPVPEVQLRIVNAEALADRTLTVEQFDAAACSADEPGEIMVTGEHVLKGYLNPADDAETKLRVGETIWHRTGDAGYLDASGRLWLLGRTSAVIRDERGVVYPFAIECAARQAELVAHAAVVKIDSRRVLAVQFMPEADEHNERFVVPRLYEKFAGVIDHIVVMPQLPLDARHNAKVRYPELRRELTRIMSQSKAAQQGDTRAH